MPDTKPSIDKATPETASGWLECPMCGRDNAFMINAMDESKGYCRFEDEVWAIKSVDMSIDKATPLPMYLDCPMCDTAESFVISPFDEAVGYCFEEQIAWRVKDGTTTDGTRPAKEWTVRESKVPGYSREISIVCGDLGICRMDGAGSSNPEVLSEVRATAWLIVNAVNSYVRQDIADERVKQARKEVWDAAIVEVDRLPAFNDQNLLRLTFQYERDREAGAAEGEGCEPCQPN